MTDKAEESAVGPRSQMKHPRKSITPPSSKKMQRMALLSVKEEREGASHPGGSAISLEDDDFKVAAMSASDVPDELPIPMVINMEIKEQLKKEIREFGGQHEKILKLLEGVQGPPELQRKFVVYAMKQAVREQRQELIGHLQKVLDKLELDHFLKKDIHTDNL